MTKKHFIALADAIRDFNKYTDTGCTTANHFDAQQLNALADFCKQQNPQFNRSRWLSYIASECGPNGGRK